ncbi:MAG: HigA family addiction module antitoxin [Armatimonadota bacterium]
MSNAMRYTYQPDHLVTPGDVIQDHLDSLGMKQIELADRLGMTVITINEIINGKSPITHETSIKLERVLGRPSHYWNNLESQYQDDKIRILEQQRLEESLDWLNRVPVSEMVNLGWVRKFTDKSQQLDEILCFYGVSSPEQWRNVWLKHQVAFRHTSRYAACAEIISAWLRRGEILTHQISCGLYDSKQFQTILVSLRQLTSEPIERLVTQLQTLCLSAGVVVVFVPELQVTGVFGATRWIGDRPTIQLSLRYKSNDHLWFTFYHEAAHILKHGRKEVFIEQAGLTDDEELEADAFAQNQLIPPAKYRQFLSTWDKRSLVSIKRFAEELGIAPGIVVGRLQHDNLLPHQTGNKLKVLYHGHSPKLDDATSA